MPRTNHASYLLNALPRLKSTVAALIFTLLLSSGTMAQQEDKGIKLSLLRV